MKCLICGKDFILKRSFKDLFRFDNKLICNECLKSNPIELSYSDVPLSERRILTIVSMFNDHHPDKSLAFTDEFSTLYERLALKNKQKTLLFYDSFTLDSKSLYELDSISKIDSSDVLIFTSNFNI